MSYHKDKILLIAGGSDPMGSEIDGTQDSEYNRAHSFAGRLTDPGRIFADYEAVNICAGGISNSFILRNTLLWFDKYYDSSEVNIAIQMREAICYLDITKYKTK